MFNKEQLEKSIDEQRKKRHEDFENLCSKTEKEVDSHPLKNEIRIYCLLKGNFNNLNEARNELVEVFNVSVLEAFFFIHPLVLNQSVKVDGIYSHPVQDFLIAEHTKEFETMLIWGV